MPAQAPPHPRPPLGGPLYYPPMQAWSLVGGAWREGEAEGAELAWYDLVGPESGALVELGKRFGLHPLAIEDCISLLPHAPKIDDFGDYLFIVLHVLRQGDEGDDPITEELDAFLGRDFLITYQDEALPTHGLVQRAINDGHRLRPGPDGLFYEVVDRAVDGFLPVVNALGERLDLIQDQIIRSAGGGNAVNNRRILGIRAAGGRLRRVLTPQLGVVQRLSRGEFDLIQEPNRIYLRDVYDHLVRIDLALEGLREDADVALNSYLGALNNRLNEEMKVLSVVAALALPATVITGIFGTNFDDIPGLHNRWGFAVMLAAMFGVQLAMFAFFRRRGWF